MRNFVIGSIVLLAMAGTARSEEPKQPPKKLAVDLGGGVKLDLVLIPAGSFKMGDENNGPVHKVNITKPFYLGKYVVTQEQWKVVMGNNPSHFKGPKNPVESVSWDDCQKFFDKLNEKSHPGAGKFQLPTEAQWEYACRAGSTTTYYFGDNESRLGDYAWYAANSGPQVHPVPEKSPPHLPTPNDMRGETHPVGQKKPNAFGLYDMHGNVWEWCADWYDSGYYAKSPADDPRGPTKGEVRVSRGGGWLGAAVYCRSALRGGRVPGQRDIALGLRVCYVPAE